MFSLANHNDPQSLAARYRRRRFDRFVNMLTMPSPRIVDVGGGPGFWEHQLPLLPKGSRVTVLNLSFPKEAVLTGPTYVTGDATDMRLFRDNEFDVCFSNSVIEHVGGLREQERMAAEVRRIARAYFIQTPNYSFPLEPHSLVVGWQFMPIAWRVRLLQTRDCGWLPRAEDRETAREVVESIRLLREPELQRLFPDAQILREKVGPLVKSLIACRMGSNLPHP
jgi:hypothetical protein